MQTNIEPPAMPAEANDSRTASDEAVVCKELLGDTVASKTRFVMQICDTKGEKTWGDQNYHKTAEEALEAARREAKWDFYHDMTRYHYRAIIRIESDHLLSPNGALCEVADKGATELTDDAARHFRSSKWLGRQTENLYD